MTGEIFCPKCGAPNPPETVYCGKCGEKVKRGDTIGQVVDPLIGSFVGDRFLVHEKLGEGGMGIVYRAEQTAIQRAVALKVLHAHLTQDESLHARFHNEAAASSRLTHPNTVTIYDFGKTNIGSLYIAMEFIQGVSLDEEIRKNGPMEWKRTCRIAVQICGSLGDAHSHGIVHRDLKPENVMLCMRGGESDVVKVLDFGIAKIVENEGKDQRQALTKTGMVFGTPQYMSPEQIRGEKVDHRTDIYSMGVILYQMLTGSLPFISEMPMGVLSKHLVDAPPSFKQTNPAVDVPEALESIVMSTLSKKAEDRPQSMKQLASMLAEAVGTISVASVGKQPAAATVPTPGPGAGKVKKTEARQTPPKTLKQQATAADGSGKKGKAGVVAAVVFAALVVIAGVGVAAYSMGWFGAKPRQARTTPVATVEQQTPPPLQPPVQAPVATPTQTPTSVAATTPVPAETQPSDTPSATNNKDNNKNPAAGPAKPKPKPKPDDKPKPEDTPAEPAVTPPIVDPVVPPKPQHAKCSYSAGNSSLLTGAVMLALRAREKGIKSCVQGNSGGTSKLSFNIDQGANQLTNLKAVASSPMDSCLQRIMSGSYKFTAPTTSVGTATFILEAENNLVKSCSVEVTTRGTKPIVMPKPIKK